MEANGTSIHREGSTDWRTAGTKSHVRRQKRNEDSPIEERRDSDSRTNIESVVHNAKQEAWTAVTDRGTKTQATELPQKAEPPNAVTGASEPWRTTEPRVRTRPSAPFDRDAPDPANPY
jgi:hypothetical protein